MGLHSVILNDQQKQVLGDGNLVLHAVLCVP